MTRESRLPSNAMRRAVLATTFLLLPLVAAEGHAHACGGAFFVDPTTVHVTAHRMAISITADRTILWDQIEYQGDPKDFAFVLPVPAGSTVELGDDAWLTALDAYTAPVIYAPRESSHGGCALMGCASTETTTAGNASARGNGTNAALSVGPYLVSTVTPKTAADLESTLTQSGLTVPAGTEALLASYLSSGMSFVVMRLRPGCGERSIVPVRIVMPGSHPSIPLRLASIGASSSAAVDLEIFVLGDGRWAPLSYPEGTIDFSALRADTVTNNYAELASSVFASQGGRTFLTELAGPANAVSIDQTDLRTTVAAVCAEPPTTPSGGTCTNGTVLSDGGDPYFDAAAIDASDNGARYDAGPQDAGEDAGDAGDDAGDGGAMMFRFPRGTADGRIGLQNAGAVHACSEPSDLTRATQQTPFEKMYITRLRARIPAAQLAATDLTLRPWLSGDGPVDVSQYHQAMAGPTDAPPTSDPGAACRAAPTAGGSTSRPRAGVWAAIATAAFLLAAIARRRRR